MSGFNLDDYGPCIEWPHRRDKKGYGQRSVRGGVKMNAHRAAFIDAGGQVGTDQDVDHLCGNRACVNPAHLEAVSHAENVRRAWAKRTTCRNGHPITDDSTIKRTWAGREIRLCLPCHQDNHRRKHARRMAGA